MNQKTTESGHKNLALLMGRAVLKGFLVLTELLLGPKKDTIAIWQGSTWYLDLFQPLVSMKITQLSLGYYMQYSLKRFLNVKEILTRFNKSFTCILTTLFTIL